MFPEFTFAYSKVSSEVFLDVVNAETGEFTNARETPDDSRWQRASFGGKLYQNEFVMDIVVNHLVAVAADFDFSICSDEELAAFIAAFIKRSQADRVYSLGSLKSFVDFVQQAA